MLRNIPLLPKSAFPLSLCLGLAALVPSIGLAETTTSWTVLGYVTVGLENYPMADGSTLQTYSSKVIYVASDGEMAGQYYSGDCAGTATISADASYGATWGCTITMTPEDAFTVSNVRDDGVAFETVITGGKGKFKGATGGSKGTWLWGDTNFGDRAAFTDTITLTLP